MNSEKKDRERISLRIRKNCPEHQILLRRCKNRDRKKYRSMTDYLAAAVEALENDRYFLIRMNIDNMTKKELDAVNVLLQHGDE